MKINAQYLIGNLPTLRFIAHAKVKPELRRKIHQFLEACDNELVLFEKEKLRIYNELKEKYKFDKEITSEAQTEMTKELLKYTDQEIEIEKPDVDANQVIEGINKAGIEMSYLDEKLINEFLGKK
tara:strand:+ start:1692 stop:2066 length:375 start_codon:yes stop_codon:yes gene_type:complete